MNPQPEHLDARIDRVLNALRDTETPTGLDERVAQRITERSAALRIASAETHTSATPSFLDAMKNLPNPLVQSTLYRFAAASLILLLALSIFVVHTHHSTPAQNVASIPSIHSLFSAQTPETGMQSTFPRSTSASHTPASETATSDTTASDTSTSFEGPGLQSRHKTGTENAALAAEGDVSHSTREEIQRAVLTPTATPDKPTTPPGDPDAIALAETAAPSHPAPPTPLTPQERLLLTAAQKGSPILLAELQPARDLALRAAAGARKKAGLQEFARNLLAPLALSESLAPIPQDDAQPTPSLIPNESQ